MIALVYFTWNIHAVLQSIFAGFFFDRLLHNSHNLQVMCEWMLQLNCSFKFNEYLPQWFHLGSKWHKVNGWCVATSEQEGLGLIEPLCIPSNYFFKSSNEVKIVNHAPVSKCSVFWGLFCCRPTSVPNWINGYF